MSFGIVLGLLGRELAGEARLIVMTVALLAGFLPAVLELWGRRVDPPELDVETPQNWVHDGSLRWAARSGAVLGAGAFSRIGFWLWYVIPISAFLSGSPRFGATVYGVYALFRAAPAWVIVWATSRRWITEDPGGEMASFRPLAHRLSAGTLWVVLVSGFVTIAM